MTTTDTQDRIGEAFVAMCPDCGSHLEDTWNHDTSQCGQCGFAYVDITTQHHRGHGPSPRTLTKAKYAATTGVILAFIGGIATAALYPTTTALTQATLARIVRASFVGAFTTALAIGIVSASIEVITE